MFKPLFVLSPVMFCLVSLAPGAARAAEVGLITSLSGEVGVKRAPSAKSTKASVMQTLSEGSTINVGARSRAVVVMFRGGARYELAPGSVTSVSSDSCRHVSGPVPKTLAGLQIRQAKLLEGSRVASGRAASTVLRNGKSARIELHSLSATSVLTPRPVFAWGAIEGATSYKVRLWNEDDEVVWQSEAASTRLAYPTDAVALPAGTDYLWTVTTTVGDTSYKGEGIFQVLDAEKSRAVQAELDAIDASQDEALVGVLRAEIFARNELWDDAIATYQQLDAKFPGSEAIQGALTNLLEGQARTTKNGAQPNATALSNTASPAR